MRWHRLVRAFLPLRSVGLVLTAVVAVSVLTASPGLAASPMAQARLHAAPARVAASPHTPNGFSSCDVVFICMDPGTPSTNVLDWHVMCGASGEPACNTPATIPWSIVGACVYGDQSQDCTALGAKGNLPVPGWLTWSFKPNPTTTYGQRTHMYLATAQDAPTGTRWTLFVSCGGCGTNGTFNLLINSNYLEIYQGSGCGGANLDGTTVAGQIGTAAQFTVCDNLGNAPSEIVWNVAGAQYSPSAGCNPNPAAVTGTPCDQTAAGSSVVAAGNGYPLSDGATSVQVSPLTEVNSQTINFDWAKAGTFAVSVMGTTANGQARTIAEAGVKVTAPKLSATGSSLLAPVQVDLYDSSNSCVGRPSGSWWLQLGYPCATPATPGITWTYGLSSATGGQIAITQVIDYADDYGSTNGTWQADTCGFYLPPVPDSQRWRSADSPGELLTVNTHTYTEAFNAYDYFMYQPPGGIWVTLGEVDWGWSGQASNVGGTWTLQNPGEYQGKLTKNEFSLPVYSAVQPGLRACG